MHATREMLNRRRNEEWKLYSKRHWFVAVLALGRNLWISLELDGKYGTCLKLTRGKRFIALSTSVWLKLRRHVPKLKTPGYNVKLTEAKEVTVITFTDGAQYVSFHNKYKRNADVYSSYINLNDEEWSCFLAALDKIDAIIPPRSQEIIPCPDCRLMKTVVSVCQGRMQQTTLTIERHQEVHENNNHAHNQEMYQCEYCGGYSFQPESGCHCHQYNCRECEPNNFCTTCGSIKILAVQNWAHNKTAVIQQLDIEQTTCILASIVQKLILGRIV